MASSARPAHGVRRVSLTTCGALGRAGKSWSEKNDSGASTLAIHGSPRFAATSGAAKVIGCESSRSAPSTAAVMSS